MMVTTGSQNDHCRNMKWKDEYAGGVLGGYSEVFLKVMNESEDFDPFQKNALLKFGINYDDQAHELFQASYHAAIYMGDVELFSQGLRMIADILMDVSECTRSSSGVDQSKMTIHGLCSFIKSAKELLKANEISDDEHAMLLSALFSKYASMELMFTLFHGLLFHKLVAEHGEETKIGKGIISHSISDLTLLCKSMELSTGLRGNGKDGSMLDQALNRLRDCKDTNACDQGSVHDASWEHNLVHPSIANKGHTHHIRHGPSLVAHGSANVDGIEADSVDRFGREIIFHLANNVIDIGRRDVVSSCNFERNEDIVKKEHYGAEYLSAMKFKDIMNGMCYWLKEVCMNLLLHDYSSESGQHVTKSSKKPYKAGKGLFGALPLWHRSMCFAILFFVGFQEARATDNGYQSLNRDVDDGKGRVPSTDKTPYKTSSSLRHRSVTDKTHDWMKDQEGGDEIHDFSDITNKTSTQDEMQDSYVMVISNNTSLNEADVRMETETRDLQSAIYCYEPRCTQAVWDANAGGHSCGARITWLQNALGYSYGAACNLVYSEFPSICCRPSYCSSQPTTDAKCFNELRSDQGCFAAMQQDGNLVVYNGNAIWASNTNGRGAGAPYTLWMQSNGNAVVKDRLNTVIWNSDTVGRGVGAPYRLDMQDNCGLVINDKADNKIWASVPARYLSASPPPGSCDAVAYTTLPRGGSLIGSVPVDGVVSCELECMKNRLCVSFILNSANAGGTCNLYSNLPDTRYYSGGAHTFGRCTRPTLTASSPAIYIMNAGVGGYLSSQDINPYIKPNGNSWELWKVVSVGTGGQYYIMDHRGRYLSAQPSGVVEFRSWRSTWETWTIVKVRDGIVSIKSCHGKFLKAESNGWVVANAGSVNGWEHWSLTNNNAVKGGPDGIFSLGMAVGIPLLVLFTGGAGYVAGGAAATIATSTTAAVTATAASTQIAASIAMSVGLLLIPEAIEQISKTIKIEPLATQVATAPVAYAAMF